MDELDLSAILIPAQAKDPRGEKGFDPRMMSMLLLYSDCVGTVSSRKIERACYEDLAFLALTRNQQPVHSRISEFRCRNLDALKVLFVQILRLWQKAGMVSLGHVPLDGTKVKANPSKHKAMSHERMLRAQKQLAQEINVLMRKAEILDAQEDPRYGKPNRGSDLPEELRSRLDSLECIRRARKEMEAETAATSSRQRQEEAKQAIAEAYAAQEAEGSEAEHAELNKRAHAVAAMLKPHERRRSRPPRKQAWRRQIWSRFLLTRCPGVAWPGKPMGHPKARPSAITATRACGYMDPDSHLMQPGGSYLQDYNCHLAVDSDHQVIVAVGVSNQPPDVEHLEPMLQRIAATAGALPDFLTTDAGYWSETNAEFCAEQGIDAYIATGRLNHGQPLLPKRGPMPGNADAKSRIALKLSSKAGSAIYAQRKAIVEPVNGQIKEARGLRRFLLRGLEKVEAEWHLMAATHNLLKLIRHRQLQQSLLLASV